MSDIHATWINDTLANIRADIDAYQTAIDTDDEYFAHTDGTDLFEYMPNKKVNLSSGTVTWLDIEANDITANSQLFVADDIVHEGDTDTYIAFSTDQQDFYCGSALMMSLIEDTTDSVALNPSGGAVNVVVGAESTIYPFEVRDSTATTDDVQTIAHFFSECSGVPTDNFGGSIILGATDTGTASDIVADISWAWSDATFECGSLTFGIKEGSGVEPALKLTNDGSDTAMTVICISDPSITADFTVDCSGDLKIESYDNTIIVPAASSNVFLGAEYSSGNYCEVEADGTIELIGDATGYEDENINPLIGWRDEAGYPDKISIASTSIECVAFDKATEEAFSGGLEVPHSAKLGATLSFHVHWSPTDTDTGDVRWGLEYAFFQEDTGAVSTGTTIYVTDTAGGTAWVRQTVAFASISVPASELGLQFAFRLFRDATDVADTYDNDAAITSTVGLHYEIDTPAGSRTVTTK